MGNFDWHGYPSNDGHPERPWWRRAQREVGPFRYSWVRSDGAEVRGGEKYVRGECGGVGHQADETWDDIWPRVVAYDKEHPLPPPPPLCGQVWVCRESQIARQVIAECDGMGIFLSPFGHMQLGFIPDIHETHDLVAGLGAPWSPLAMGKEEA